MMKRLWIQLILLFVVLIGSTSLLLFQPKLLVSFELKIKDQMMLWRGELPADDRIVIVDIDEASLKQIGQWPWPRDTVAELLQKLSDLEVGMIGLDVVFVEPDNSSPMRVIQRLAQSSSQSINIVLNALPDYDAQLAETLANTPTILGYVFALTKDKLQPDEIPPAKALIIERDKPAVSYLLKAHRPILNLPVLQQAAYSSGYFNTLPDDDGVVRSVPLVIEYDGLLYPSLSLEMMRVAFDSARVTVQYDQKGVESIQVGDVQIPTDPFGRIQVNYRGGAYQYHYISAADVLSGRVEPEVIAGKIVLLGTSAAGLLDLRSTPFDSVYPGVEVHATILDNILNQDFIMKPMWVMGADLLTLVVAVVLVGIALMMLGSVWSFSALALLVFAIGYGHYSVYSQQGVLLNTLIPLSAVLTLFILGTVVNYFFESRQKAMIKSRFARKVSPAVALVSGIK